MKTELRNLLAALHSASFGWAMVCCLGDRELAEDVLQSVYVKVLDGRARFDGRSAFRTWLFAVIRNTARNQLRKQWCSRVIRLEFETAELPHSTHEENVIALEDDEIRFIRETMDQLPRQQRQVVHLVFYEELTVREAAQVMSVTVGTASQHFARAKKTLTSRLKTRHGSKDEPVAQR